MNNTKDLNPPLVEDSAKEELKELFEELLLTPMKQEIVESRKKLQKEAKDQALLLQAKLDALQFHLSKLKEDELPLIEEKLRQVPEVKESLQRLGTEFGTLFYKNVNGLKEQLHTIQKEDIEALDARVVGLLDSIVEQQSILIQQSSAIMDEHFRGVAQAVATASEQWTKETGKNKTEAEHRLKDTEQALLEGMGRMELKRLVSNRIIWGLFVLQSVIMGCVLYKVW